MHLIDGGMDLLQLIQKSVNEARRNLSLLGPNDIDADGLGASDLVLFLTKGQLQRHDSGRMGLNENKPEPANKRTV